MRNLILVFKKKHANYLSLLAKGYQSKPAVLLFIVVMALACASCCALLLLHYA